MGKRLLDTFHKVLAGAQDQYWRFLERHLHEPFERSVLETTLIVLGLAAFDALASPPPGFRLIYVAPVWFATRMQGVRAGLVGVAIVSLVLPILDASQGRVTGLAVLLDLVVYSVLLTLLMLHIARMEHGIQAYARMASVDPLTGVYNRLALHEAASKEIARALAEGRTLVVAVIDCDHFKQLNDELGHAYGDSVLITLARLLRKSVRASGIVARTGGDEFVAILPGRHLDEAGALIESVAADFAERTSAYGRQATISYGLARLKIHGSSLDELISAADRRMYLAKYARVPEHLSVKAS